MNSLEYITVLKNAVLPFLRKFRRQKLIFQQDNASCHKSAETKRFFQQEKIATIDWPPCSPDLNPVENLWGMIVRDVYAGNKQYDIVDELKNAITASWNSIAANVLKSLSESMKNRLFQVINRSGGRTDY